MEYARSLSSPFSSNALLLLFQVLNSFLNGTSLYFINGTWRDCLSSIASHARI